MDPQKSLHSAWSAGKLANFESLIKEHISDLTPKSGDEGRSILWYAASIGSAESIKMLMKRGFSANSSCATTGWTALHAAIFWNHFEAAEVLLKVGKVSPNTPDKYQQTALMRAALDGNEELANLLLSYGADPNKCDKDKRTALMLAAGRRHAAIVELLLEHKANPNLQDKDGLTAIMRASNKDIFRLLREHGADTTLTDNSGKSLKDHMNGRKEILDLLE